MTTTVLPCGCYPVADPADHLAFWRLAKDRCDLHDYAPARLLADTLAITLPDTATVTVCRDGSVAVAYVATAHGEDAVLDEWELYTWAISGPAPMRLETYRASRKARVATIVLHAGMPSRWRAGVLVRLVAHGYTEAAARDPRLWVREQVSASGGLLDRRDGHEVLRLTAGCPLPGGATVATVDWHGDNWLRVTTTNGVEHTFSRWVELRRNTRTGEVTATEPEFAGWASD